MTNGSNKSWWERSQEKVKEDGLEAVFLLVLNRGYLFLLRALGVPALIFGDVLLGGDMIYRLTTGASTGVLPPLAMAFIFGLSLDAAIALLLGRVLNRPKEKRTPRFWIAVIFVVLFAFGDSALDMSGTYTGLFGALVGTTPNVVGKGFPRLAKYTLWGLTILTGLVSLAGNWVVTVLLGGEKQVSSEGASPVPQPAAEAPATPVATPATPATPTPPQPAQPTPPPMTRLPGQRPAMRPPMPQGDPRRNPPRR